VKDFFSIQQLSNADMQNIVEFGLIFSTPYFP